MKDSNETMTNNDVQKDRSASPIPRDILPIMEVKRNNCQHLHSYPNYTTQLYIHIAIINKVNNHMLASVPTLNQKSSKCTVHKIEH